MIPADRQLTIAVDGKTIRSTVKRKDSNYALHIVSAQLAEMGLTYAQKTVANKSNEIPIVSFKLSNVVARFFAFFQCMSDKPICPKCSAKEVIKLETPEANSDSNAKNAIFNSLALLQEAIPLKQKLVS